MMTAHPKRIPAAIIATGLATLSLSVPVALAQPDGDRAVVATALPVTHSIAAALTEGTSIEVRHVPQGGRRMAQQPDYFGRRAQSIAGELDDITAVITIGKLWNDDPLYTLARAVNIRVVDIDATKPWSTQLEGVAVATEPVTDARWTETAATEERLPSSFFWMSPANGARAADIVGRDLMRLVPGAASLIEQNLASFRSEMLTLQTEYQLRLAELPDLTVAALAPEFIYLTNAFGIYVDSYFLKQDISWTDDDLTAFQRYLESNAIGVVIHKWEPDTPIAAAIENAGARLVVLDPIDLGIEEDDRIAPDSYQRLLRFNIDAVYEALKQAQ